MIPDTQATITWIYGVPSLVLTVLAGLLAARLLLVLGGGGSQRLVPGLLRRVTDPVARAVRRLTPGAVPDPLVLMLAAVWLMSLRIVWLYACIAGGLRPSLGG